MHELHLLLIFHLIGATIWVGGHIILSLVILPQVWKEKSVEKLFSFESKYERIGLPALLIMVITGVRMSYIYTIKISNWFHFENPIERVVSLKLIGLAMIVLLAISAQFYVLPRLKSDYSKLPLMTFHIIAVTTISILMLILGSFVRYGGI